jgi:hypothetical protein
LGGERRRGLLGEERKITVGTGFYIEGDRREIPGEERGGEVSLVKKGRSLWGLGSIWREIEERSLGKRKESFLVKERKIKMKRWFCREGVEEKSLGKREESSFW